MACCVPSSYVPLMCGCEVSLTANLNPARGPDLIATMPPSTVIIPEKVSRAMRSKNLVLCTNFLTYRSLFGG